jgi:hypothetical protein
MPCVATFISDKLKCHGFCFIFSLFFFYKIGEQEGRTSLAQWGGLAPMGEGRYWEKRDRRVDTMQKMCIHVCKCKNDTC